MAWQMVDDLTGDVVPEQDAQVLELTLRPRGAHVSDVVAAWDVASTDPAQLLPQLGKHLSGGTTRPEITLDTGPLHEQLAQVREQVEATAASDTVETTSLGRRIHEGLRTLDLPWRVEIGLRRLGYRLGAAYEGAAVDDENLAPVVGHPGVPPGYAIPISHVDDACPHDPDGLHFPTCGCDGVDPLNLNAGQAAVDDQPAEQVGEAEKGRATDAQVRAWCRENDVQHSTHGKLNNSAREAYDAAHQTSPPARPGDEEPPASDPFPPADRASADPDPTVDEPSASDAVEGAPPPDPGATGQAAGPATTETPEPAGRASEETPAPAQAGPGRAPEVAPVGDGERSRPEQIDLAEELAAGGATPKSIVEKTGVTLDEARAAVRRQR